MQDSPVPGDPAQVRCARSSACGMGKERNAPGQWRIGTHATSWLARCQMNYRRMAGKDVPFLSSRASQLVICPVSLLGSQEIQILDECRIAHACQVVPWWQPGVFARVSRWRPGPSDAARRASWLRSIDPGNPRGAGGRHRYVCVRCVTPGPPSPFSAFGADGPRVFPPDGWTQRTRLTIGGKLV